MQRHSTDAMPGQPSRPTWLTAGSMQAGSRTHAAEAILRGEAVAGLVGHTSAGAAAATGTQTLTTAAASCRQHAEEQCRHGHASMAAGSMAAAACACMHRRLQAAKAGAAARPHVGCGGVAAGVWVAPGCVVHPRDDPVWKVASRQQNLALRHADGGICSGAAQAAQGRVWQCRALPGRRQDSPATAMQPDADGCRCGCTRAAGSRRAKGTHR